MAEVLHRSEAKAERLQGPLRRARFPGEAQPVTFAVHGAMAGHCGRAPGSYEPHAATMNDLVAATAG